MTISAVLRCVTDSAGIYRVGSGGNSIGISRMQDAAVRSSLISRKKWKVSGDCRNVPRVGRPTKLGNRRVLTREIRKNRTQPMALIREEFQQASGSIVFNEYHP
ncbi:protein-tyrosine sulfotransferase [Caerostris extrusa]|uniref:Protein-tyrosine sulfotransferase n=1 Tax=Caerostris extrusa TaxID=172846 RepID=A0AAV4VDV7_CAEEX|nr:protein-tyrosine sulfotransferase [Caerostris extrusa]